MMFNPFSSDERSLGDRGREGHFFRDTLNRGDELALIVIDLFNLQILNTGFRPAP
jgi:hypothetical protein